MIEDAAEAHGIMVNKRPCGRLEKFNYSFYANKHITAGEGGAVLTDDTEIFKELIQMKILILELIVDLNMIIYIGITEWRYTGSTWKFTD